MRIAVISDIHGNYHALSKVLEDIKKSDVQVIYCLGDAISLGHQTNQVLKALKNIEDLKMIRGNHDEEVLKAVRGEASDVTGEEHRHHLWVADHIRHEYVRMLKDMPLTIEKAFFDHNILLTHYHLEKNNSYSNIDYKPSLESLQKIYKDSRHRVILYGHDHMVQYFEGRDRIFINPGALGVTSDEFAPYAILDIEPDGSINAEFKKAAYDRDAFIRELEDQNPPALEFILNVLLKERG